MAETASTRDRLLDAALHLFAERGFRGTSVGDIEAAAGLTARGGGFYKHFESKRQILEVALERHLSELQTTESVMDLMPLGDWRAELTLLSRWTLQQLGNMRPLIQIIHREAGDFPELVTRYHDRIVKQGYRLASDWIKHKTKEAGLPDQDADAFAAVGLGALVNYRIQEALLGEPPAGVSEKRFLDAYLAVWTLFGNLLQSDEPRVRGAP